MPLFSKKLQNLAFCVVQKACFSRQPVGIIGAPFSKGQSKSGVERAPDALREFGLVQELQDLGIDVKDYGNLEFDHSEEENSGKLKHPLAVGAACKKISEAVQRILTDNRRCLMLGGDHSLGMGTVHGHAQVHPELCVLWVDAHADINTATTTDSGHMHGMPCSFFIKELQKYRSQCDGFHWIQPCVSKANLAYIGLRDIDPLEKLILKKENILHFTMRDIDKLGIFKVISRAMESINPGGNLSTHVSFDIDSVDKLITPSTGTPVHGGLTVREALCIAEELSKIEALRGLDIVEVNPLLGNKEQAKDTLDIVALLIKTFFGYARCGRSPRNLHDVPV